MGISARHVLRRLAHVVGAVKRQRATYPNLTGDRDIEWSWVFSRLPTGPGRALDFGAVGSDLAFATALKGFETTAIDLAPIHWYYQHPLLSSLQGDVLTLSFPSDHFDLVINCSTVEHVGLAGRYGVTRETDSGDLDAMSRLWGWMKPSGRMILTVPVGEDAIFSPYCRIYGRERLPALLGKFEVVEETFWVKDESNRWRMSQKSQALSFRGWAGSDNPLEVSYALGCFVLSKHGSP